MLRDVAVLALDGSHAFELGVFCEVFGIDRGDDGLPGYDFAVVSATGSSVPTRHGFHIQPSHGLSRPARAQQQASTHACTSSLRNTAAPSPTPSPAAWSPHRTETVVNASTANAPTPHRAPVP
jgi:hypothetical protein